MQDTEFYLFVLKVGKKIIMNTSQDITRALSQNVTNAPRRRFDTELEECRSYSPKQIILL